MDKSMLLERLRALKAMQTREVTDRAVIENFAASTEGSFVDFEGGAKPDADNELRDELLDVHQCSQNKVDALHHVIDRIEQAIRESDG